MAALSLITATNADALDVAMGADTLFHQVEGATVVTTARFRSREPGRLVFDRDAVLMGSVGSTIVAANDPYLDTLPLRPGTQYLLFPRTSSDGALRFPLSRSSVVEVGAAEMPATLGAVRTFLQERLDRVRLRPA